MSKVLVLAVFFLTHSESLYADQKLSVTPMIKRLTESSLTSKSLVVETKLYLSKSSRIYLEPVRATQKPSGQIEWRPVSDRNQIFNIPFKEKLLEKGEHTLRFTARPGSRSKRKPMRFAVAISYRDRLGRVSGKGPIKLKAEVRMRQIFQITYPGWARGARRYQIELAGDAQEKAGMLAVRLVNRAASPYYLKASARFFSRSKSKQISTRSRPLILASEHLNNNVSVEQVALYPNFPVDFLVDTRDLEKGAYKTTLSFLMRDSLGRRKMSKSLSFSKSSGSKSVKAKRSKIVDLKASLGKTSRSTEVILESRKLSGVLRLSVDEKSGKGCRLRSKTAILRPSAPARVVLAGTKLVNCVLRVLHESAEASYRIDQGSVSRIYEQSSKKKLKKSSPKTKGVIK